MNAIEKQLAETAINDYHERLSNSGCNDLILDDSPEARQLLKEYSAWNLNCSVDEVENHPEYYEPSIADGKIYTIDSVLIFILKKSLKIL